MKIGQKTSLATLVVILSFTGTLIYAGVAVITAQRLQLLSKQASDTVSASFKVYGEARGMLVNSGSLETARERWHTAYQEQRSQMQELLQHPAQRHLSQASRQRLRGSESTFQAVEQAFEDLEERIDNLLAYNVDGILTMPGILRLETYLAANAMRSDPARSAAASAASRVESAVSMNNQLAQYILQPLSEQIAADARDYSVRALWTAVSAAALVILGSLLFTAIFSRRLSGKMQKLHSVMAAMAERDFSTRVQMKSRDEIGEIAAYINGIQNRVGEFFGSVVSSAESVGELKDGVSAGAAESAAALNQITRSVESLNQQFTRLDSAVQGAAESITGITSGVSHLTESIQRQSAAVEQSLASFEEMNASVGNVAQVAADRRSGAVELLSVVNQGGESISSTNETISDIARHIDSVLEIVQVINAVSQQTNLLSMNAAIESAHAGEAGKGFAVVAEEIRKLSDSTREHAADIGSIVETITAKIQTADQASSQGASAFANVQQEVSRFAASMEEIHTGMNELAAGSRQVLTATQELSGITQEIRSDSGDISRQNSVVEEAMQHAQHISGAAISGMQEMEIGIREVLEALQEMTDKTADIRDRMETLQEVVRGFTL